MQDGGRRLHAALTWYNPGELGKLAGLFTVSGLVAGIFSYEEQCTIEQHSHGGRLHYRCRYHPPRDVAAQILPVLRIQVRTLLLPKYADSVSVVNSALC